MHGVDGLIYLHNMAGEALAQVVAELEEARAQLALVTAERDQLFAERKSSSEETP